ncbi:hypothetical protein BDW68DRAFT_182268 [Aspergillus falconensis]
MILRHSNTHTPALKMWPLLIALGIAPIGVIAQLCDNSGAAVRGQQDIDALAQNCTSLRWSLPIDDQFSGPFVLPNIVNITYGVDDEYGYPVRITSFDMPDLENAGGIDLSPLPVLESWSVPKLSSIGYILLDIPSHLESLQFPALREAKNIRIAGNLTE